jgi:PTH1 family peptidyl-tRNA hydrolase
VGLGNPGPEYADTRHNAGFRLADRLAERWGFGPFRRGERARETSGTVDGTPVKLLKPLTYMNRSGAAVAPLRALPGFDPAQHLLILVDEVALPLGRFRLRGAGSAGGHNGLKSVEGSLQRQDYARLRIGVGPKPTEIDDLADYVLAEFTREERQVLEDLLDPMSEAVECWLMEGIEKAMSKHNKSANSEP